MMMLQHLPQILVAFRLLSGPLLLLDAWDGQTSLWFIILFILAFLSDIFDGVVARRLGVSNAALRQADSWADVCFYICVFASAWIVYPNLVQEFSTPLLTLVFAQGLWWIVNLVKYGKPASYHTYSAKLWGITLFIATIALFGFNYAGLALWLTIIVGLVHTIEEILMTLLLPVWQHDVLSIFHAWKLRKQFITNPSIHSEG